jgi:hypothetical protein
MILINRKDLNEINKNLKSIKSKTFIKEFFIDKHDCKDCGNDIIYYDTKIILDKDYNLKIKGKSYKSTKWDIFKLSICESCLSKKFPIYENLNKSRVFNMPSEITKYAFNIDDNFFNQKLLEFKIRSKDDYIRKYGELEGLQRWDNYRLKKSYSNTFEYKNKKYGMTIEEFKDYNKSRACTKENFIQRYGEEKGLKKWDLYVNKQKLTKSKEYIYKKHGKDAFIKINKSKANTLENFIKRHGIEIGNKKYMEYIEKQKVYFSKKSQDLFKIIDDLFKDKTTYYNNKNTEYGVNLIDKYAKLDFFILEDNICIEFNGDVFHANPNIYKENDNPNPFNKNITAKQIWDNDRNRYEKLYNLRNIRTIIIWENYNFNLETFKSIYNFFIKSSDKILNLY